MPQTLSLHHQPPERVVDVLVVAAEAAVRARLAAGVWCALPTARIRELSQLNDLVYRVTGSVIDLVVVDAAPPQSLPLTPLLVKMLKGVQPALRIVGVVPEATPAATPATTPVMPATDASLSEAGLADWLRQRYGSSGSGGGATPADAASPPMA